MKKLVKNLAIAASLALTSAVASAQNIAVVNVGEVFQQLPQHELITKTLKDEFEVRVQEVLAMEKEMQALFEKREKDGELLGVQEVTRINRQLEAMEAEYKIKRRNLEEDQRRRGSEEQQKLMAKIQKAVTELAKAKGYDLVLPVDATAYVNDSLDITKDVIEQVSKAK